MPSPKKTRQSAKHISYMSIRLGNACRVVSHVFALMICFQVMWIIAYDILPTFEVFTYKVVIFFVLLVLVSNILAKNAILFIQTYESAHS